MSGSLLQMQFDKAMKDPTGKQGEFSATKTAGVTTANLTPLTISRNAIVPEMLELYLQESIAYGDTIKVSYTKGTIESDEGKLLESFSDVTVDNLEVAPTQHWASFPNSPVVTADYPYQAISTNNNPRQLIVYSKKLYYTSGTLYTNIAGGVGYRYTLSGSEWVLAQTITGPAGNSWSGIVECNNDVYTSASLTTVYKAKTTT